MKQIQTIPECIAEGHADTSKLYGLWQRESGHAMHTDIHFYLKLCFERSMSPVDDLYSHQRLSE